MPAFMITALTNTLAWYGLVALFGGRMTPLWFTVVFAATFWVLEYVGKYGVGSVVR